MKGTRVMQPPYRMPEWRRRLERCVFNVDEGAFAEEGHGDIEKGAFVSDVTYVAGGVERGPLCVVA